LTEDESESEKNVVVATTTTTTTKSWLPNHQSVGRNPLLHPVLDKNAKTSKMVNETKSFLS